MKIKKNNQLSLGIQLELFQSTRRLNLSETYESIPKEISSTDPKIHWVNENIADPIEKIFTIDGKTFISEISPAIIKNRKKNIFQSCFPSLREARIEYAIISMASKKLVNISTDSEESKIFTLKTTYYQIQKEIIEAINKRGEKDLSPQDCPYNVTSIKEALEVLKKTNISIKNEKGDKEYVFNRIKDIYIDKHKVVVELGNMITNYVSSGDWRATDSHSILASKGKYELKIRVLLNLKFRYAQHGNSYSPSLSYLVEKLDFMEFENKRTTLQRVTQIIQKMHEVEKIEVEKKFEGRKITDAILHIYPTASFIQTMIENNKVTKRTQEVFPDEHGKILVNPMRSDFDSDTDYKEAKRYYDVQK